MTDQDTDGGVTVVVAPSITPNSQVNKTENAKPTKRVLTEDQKERIQKNKERAQLLRQKAAARKRKLAQVDYVDVPLPNSNNSDSINYESARSCKCEENDDDGVELEDFEIGAAPKVTKKEAMSMYCLPEATLQVCSFVTKDNPRRKGWSSMKLYDRSEIRRRARERHGGLEGLVAERKKREQKRFEKVLEQTKDVFQRG